MALVMLLLGDLRQWPTAAVIGSTHFIIDLAKLYLQHKKNKRLWFFVDQGLHLTVLLLIAWTSIGWSVEFMNNPSFMNTATALVFLTMPASLVIKILLSAWSPVPVNQSEIHTESLANAGTYIGILERLLVFTFIMAGHWEGVGFMIAAKSVFRFSDLVQAKQRKLTEYVLIGTLLSFGIAIASGILVKT